MKIHSFNKKKSIWWIKVAISRTTESSGACFIRTDQLDGETDWKLRLALSSTQSQAKDEDLLRMQVFETLIDFLLNFVLVFEYYL